MANGNFTGSCGILFSEHRTLRVAPAKAITTGVWQKDAMPTAVWSGDMTDSASSPYAVEIEIYSAGSGIIRTEFGWHTVSHFAASPTTLQFDVDTSHEVAPNALDRQIVQRAAAILSSVAVWNRADTRQCSAFATTWSIYCALGRATVEVTGGFHHRRPALELVRQVIRERTVGRNYRHGLMDDVQGGFAEALRRIHP